MVNLHPFFLSPSLFFCFIKSGLALASNQIANGYLVSPLATEQRAGVAKLATGVSRGV